MICRCRKGATAFAGLGCLFPLLASAQAFGEPLDEVVVTATRREQSVADVAGSIAVKDVEQLRRDGFTYGTDEFRGVPGVFFRRGEGDGDEFAFVSMRGSLGTDGYLMMLDGVPYVGAEEEPLLTHVPYEAVERIEIYKGPASALYGRGALYGVVNYITRRPAADEITGQLSIGSDDYLRASVSLSRQTGESSGALLSASYENYDGWREHSGKRIGNLFGRYEWTLGEKTRLTAFANYIDRSSEVPNGLPVDFDGRVIDVAGGPEAFLGFGDPRNDLEALLGGVSLSREVSDTLSWQLSTQARSFDQQIALNFYDPFGFDPRRNVYAINGFRGDNQQDAYFAEASLRWRAGRHNVVAGISGERSEADDLDRWSGQFGFSPECGFNFFLIEIDYTTGQVVNRDAPCFEVDLPYTKDRFTNSFWGAFVQDEITLSERWQLTLGGRYDKFRRKATFDALPASSVGGTLRGDADAFSPKASLSYRYAHGQLYAAYGRGFNSNFGSTFEWDAAQYARPESKPTTLDSVELGWKAQLFEDLLDTSVAIFRSTQKNRRSIIPNPAAETDPFAPGNLISFGDEYRSEGVELSAALRPRAGTSLALSFTYLDPVWEDYQVVTFAGPVDLSGKRPVGVPQNLLYLAVDQSVTSWLALRATYEYYDDYMITSNNRVEGGGYDLLNLSARITAAALADTTFDLTLTNALDEEYFFFFGGRTAPTSASPGVPRQLRLTVRSSFR
jgi:outer membrane receptor protein involved in Fe transport